MHFYFNAHYLLDIGEARQYSETLLWLRLLGLTKISSYTGALMKACPTAKSYYSIITLLL